MRLYCVASNEYYSEDFVAVITINKKLITRLSELLVAWQTVKDMLEDESLYCLEFFDHTIEIYAECFQKGLPHQEDPCADPHSDWMEVPEGVEFTPGPPDEAARIDCPTMTVTEAGFLWHWYPKHGSEIFETPDLPMERVLQYDFD